MAVDSLQNFTTLIDGVDKDSFESENARREALTAARALCRRLERPMDTMLRIAWVEPPYVACLKIALDIKLFVALAKGGKGATHGIVELANETKSDKALLLRILRLLSSMDTVEEVEEGVFAATELSNAFLDRSVSSAIDHRQTISTPLFEHLPEFLKQRNYRNPSDFSDCPWHYAKSTKLSLFEWLAENPAALDMFTNHMAGYSSQRNTWDNIYPIQERLFGDEKHPSSRQDVILVDLGGGSGHDLKRFAAKFLSEEREPRLVLQDLPEVLNEACNSSLLPSSIKAVPIDFMKEAPVPGARAYYMHSVLHDWPDDEARNILTQMHGTLLQRTKDGRTPKLLLDEIVLLGRGVPSQAAALDLIMMSVFAAKERSEEEWRSLLESAGFKVTGIFSGAGVDEAIIEAEAVDIVIK